MYAGRSCTLQYQIIVWVGRAYVSVTCMLLQAASDLVWCVWLIINCFLVRYISIPRFYLHHNFSYFTYRTCFSYVFVFLYQFFCLIRAAWSSKLRDALLSLPVQAGQLVKRMSYSWVGVRRTKADTGATFSRFHGRLIVQWHVQVWAAEVSLWDSWASCWKRFFSESWKPDALGISFIWVRLYITHLFWELTCKPQILTGVGSGESVWVGELFLVWRSSILGHRWCCWWYVIFAVTIHVQLWSIQCFTLLLFGGTHVGLDQSICLFYWNILWSCDWPTGTTLCILCIAHLAATEQFILGADTVFGLQFTLEGLSWTSVILCWMWALLNSLILALMLLRRSSSNDVLSMRVYSKTHLWWYLIHSTTHSCSSCWANTCSHCASTGSNKIPLRLVVDQLEVVHLGLTR